MVGAGGDGCVGGESVEIYVQRRVLNLASKSERRKLSNSAFQYPEAMRSNKERSHIKTLSLMDARKLLNIDNSNRSENVF